MISRPVLASLFLLLALPAFAAAPESCGKTLPEIAEAATKARESGTPESKDRALACLIEAVARMARDWPVVTRSESGETLLHMPSLHGAKPKAQ